MEKILITGINGYIGSRVAKALLRDGKRIIGTDLTLDNYSEIKNEKHFAHYAANIAEPSTLPIEFRDAGILIHCAALVHKRSTDLSRANYFRINHQGTRNILAGLDAAGLKMIIFLSTVSVYGNVPPGMQPDENTIPNPDDFYGESKIAAEEEIRIFSEKHSIPYIILRLSPVYGKSFLLNINKRIYVPGHYCFYRIGKGSQKLSLCSVNNVVHVIRTVLNDRHSSGQIFNLRDPENYSINDIIDFFNVASGKKKPIITIPVMVPQIAFSCLSLVLPKKAEYYKYQLRKISMDAMYSIEKIRNAGFNLPWDLKSTFSRGPETL
jgi:UDP-glucose 4-epimerase